MGDEKKNAIAETVGVLKDLDEQSLLLILAGAQMLKARQEMETAASVIMGATGGK